MTATIAPPPTGPGLPSAPPPRSERRRAAIADPAAASGTARTIRAALATALGVTPLTALFSDIRWLPNVLLAIAMVGGIAAALRRWQRPHVWHTWCGLVALVPWLTWRFVPTHAIASVLPTGATFSDISDLLGRVRDTTSNGVAPVASDRALTLVLAAIAGLLAAFTDLVAVVGRRPALAAIPMLVIFTVAGAVRRHPVSWAWFVVAGAGLLLLLSIDARDEVRGWGRVIPRAGESRPSAVLAVSGPRIAVLALAVAVVLPLAAPGRTTNPLANAFHNGDSGSGSGPGTIGAAGVSLDPFAALKGEITQPKPVALFTVTVEGNTTAPYYLRANVLADYTDRGWSASTHRGQDITTTDFSTSPPTEVIDTVGFLAHITISGLADNPPVFANPVAVGGVDQSTGWSGEDQLLIGSRVKRHQSIDETVAQPAPTIAELTGASPDLPPEIEHTYLRRPSSVPVQVIQLVDQLVAGKNTEYAKARAISDYFTTPANGFVYSLQTASGDSGSALLDFLNHKIGFCQQFAAAMGIMLRLAGVPARVVLGYTHPPVNSNSSFTVTTSNAHAWVEAYFPSIGWVPFDPTPITSAAGAATTDLPWAPHPAAAGNPRDTIPNSKRPTRNTPSSTAPSQSAPQAGASSQASRSVPWSLVGTLAGLLAAAGLAGIPAGIRWGRRRGRLRAAAHGDPDPLWRELSDTAVDLGYVWSPVRSPRQVVTWLAGDVGPEAAQSLRRLAAAVEQARYAPPGTPSIGPGAPGSGAELTGEFRDVEAQLRAHRSRTTRITSRLLPRSLAWLPQPRARRRR